MNIIYKNNNRKYENNVIYQISIGNYNYIGLTSRPLDIRVHEHLYHASSPIRQYIKANNIDTINVKIICKLPTNKRLDKKETKAIAQHLLYKGKKQSFTYLLNRDFKGLDNMSIEELKDLISRY